MGLRLSEAETLITHIDGGLEGRLSGRPGMVAVVVVQFRRFPFVHKRLVVHRFGSGDGSLRWGRS